MSGKTHCKKALKDRYGKELPEEFLNRVVDDLDIMRAKATKEGKNFREMSARERRKQLRAIRERQLITAANLEKTARRMARYNDFAGDATGKKKGQLLREAYLSTLSNTFISRDQAGISADRLGKTLEKRYQQMLMYPMKEKGLFKITKGGSLDKEIMIELFETRQGGQPGKSNSSEARDIATNIKRVQDRIRDDYRSAGMPVRDIDGYIMKQAHDREKILALDEDVDVARRKWAESVLPLLDQERMFSLDKTKEQRLEVLTEIAQTLIDGRSRKANHLEGAADELITTANYGNVAKGALQERALHFKDGEHFYRYNKEFGRRSLFESLMTGIQTDARAIGAIEIFGSSPEAALAADSQRIKNLIGDDAEALEGFGDAIDFANNALRPQVFGYDLTLANNLYSKVNSTMRALNNAFLLGKAGLWSVVDLATAASQITQLTGDNYIKTQLNVFSDAISQINPKYKSEVTKMMGVYLDDMMALNYQRLGLTDVDDFAPGWSKNLQHYTFTLSGLNWITNVSRNATAMGISRSLGRRVDQVFGDLDISIQKSLMEFGIGPEKWDFLRQSALELSNGEKMIVPENIEDSQLSIQLQQLYDAAAEMGSPEPSARAKARLLNGTQPGTFWGEFHRAIAQFKSFPVFMHDIMMKTANSDPDIDAVTFFGDVAQGRANYRALSQLAISTTLMAYFADVLVSASDNKKPKDPTDPQTWKDALVRSGVAGLWGDLLLSDHGRYGGSRFDSLAGPVLGKADDAVSLAEDALAGKDVGRKSFDFVLKNVTPNTFYLKTGLDYMFLDDFREVLEPGYKAKKQRRQMQENRDKLF